MAKHIYHYNINPEQRFFLGHHRSLFDLIALNGNIVAHSPAPVAAFVATTAKEFYIDPQTHGFQHDPRNLKRDQRSESEKKQRMPPRFGFKESIKSLANDFLGEPFKSVLDNDTQLAPDCFLSNGKPDLDLIGSVCSKVIDFQRNVLNSHLSDEDRELIGDEAFEPSILLSPYFFLQTKKFPEWLDVNTACYEISRKSYPAKNIYLPIVVSKTVLDTSSDPLLLRIQSLQPTGILLWIDDHIEEQLSIKQLKSYVRFINRLRSYTDRIYNTHGGYFSTLLCHPEINLLDGVGHSVNYGEHRNVIPVGGGIPQAPFYFPSIHSRLKFENALEIIMQQQWLASTTAYFENVCRCAQCVELLTDTPSLDDAFEIYNESKPSQSNLEGREYPTAQARQATSRHYLYNKANEFENLSKFSSSDLTHDLKDTYNRLSSVIGDDTIGHLEIWHDVLQELITAKSFKIDSIFP